MRWRVPEPWERFCLGEIGRPHSRTLPSLALEGFLLPERACRDLPARAGTGDPDPGARADMRACPQARGLPEGTRRKPDTDGRASPEGSQLAARRQRRDRIFLNSVCRNLRGSTDAGGEDVGYFSTAKRVRIPPLTHAPGCGLGKGSHAARRSFSPQGETLCCRH